MLEIILSLAAIAAVNVWFLIGYIGSPGNFPKPLSKEEEERYLKEMYDGSIEARNILVERNLRLVAHVVKKYSLAGQDNDDLISIGTIGLIKGVSSFKAAKGARLATYAAKCIENEILMSLRNAKKLQNEVSINDKIGMDSDGNEITLIDVLEDGGEQVEEKISLKMQTAEMYKTIKEVLSPREAEIIAMRYGLLNKPVKTQNEIAEIFGISRSYVSRIEKKALLQIREKMSKKNM